MSFTLDLSAFKNLTSDKMEVAVKKTALDLTRGIIRDSPVDTGRFRANWFLELNTATEMNSLDLDKTSKTGLKTFGKAKAAIESFKGGDTIYISNNLPYGYPLEFLGHSKKSPDGFVRINLIRVQYWLNNQARKLK